MLKNLKKDYDKIILAGLLIVLAFSTVLALRTVNVPFGNVDGGTQQTFNLDVPEIIDHSITLKEYAGILTPHDVVYCRNSSCKNLISKKFVRCPNCSTDIYGVPEIDDNDVNLNLIPDDIELSWGGKLDDPLNHFRDLDGDGFRNIDEFKLKESAHDPESHPLNIYLASFAGVENRFLPIVINRIEVLESKNKQTLYASGNFRGKGGFYRSLGEDVYGYKITEINHKRSEVTVVFNKLKISLPLNKRVFKPGWPKYLVNYRSESLKLEIGEKVYLGKESYTLIEQAKEKLLFQSERSSEKVYLNRTLKLLPPVE